MRFDDRFDLLFDAGFCWWRKVGGIFDLFIILQAILRFLCGYPSSIAHDCETKRLPRAQTKEQCTVTLFSAGHCSTSEKSAKIWSLVNTFWKTSQNLLFRLREKVKKIKGSTQTIAQDPMQDRRATRVPVVDTHCQSVANYLCAL